ncbi:MAG: hemolysin family protein [Cyclobacteriaceae bacterium]|nr:hemolysin family protein [Cyclobacteriaceae bacterium]
MEDSTIIINALLFSAFFSGIEIAFISANKLQLEVQAKNGTWADRVLAEFLKNQSGFLGTTLIGNNIALVIYGIFMAKAIDPWLYEHLPSYVSQPASHLVLQTLISTLLVLFVAEFLPKSLFMLESNRVLKWLAFPMLGIYYLLWPLTKVVTWVSKMLIVYVFRLSYDEAKPVYGLSDLNTYIKNLVNPNDPLLGSDDLPDVDEEILTNAIEFKNSRIRDCMIPRTEIVAIDINSKIKDLTNSLIESGHSKVLVFEHNIDNVLGYCHAHELFKKPRGIKQIMAPIIIVPETMRAQELMVKFITDKKGIAVVVDEYGGTSGLVCLEDLIEEIVGEIHDEHDVEELEEVKIDDHTYSLSARLEIEYLNDKYNWKLPLGEYETLGGLILSITGNIPSAGQVIEFKPFSAQIIEMEEKRIISIQLKIK